jgi:nicotinamide-nucleotide amidase
MRLTDDHLHTLAEDALDKCRRAGITVATAESCTGGLVAAALTAVEGSSDVFERGFVTYSNTAKTELIGVPESLLASVGAVSEEVAVAMAKGVLEHAPVQVAVAVTGIAGPGGGSDPKPVGLVHLALACARGGVRHERRVFGGDREAIRIGATAAALRLLALGAAEAL